MRVARIRMIRGITQGVNAKQKQYYYLCPLKNVEVNDCVVVNIFLQNIDSFACAIIDELIEMPDDEVVDKRIFGVCVVKLPDGFLKHCAKFDRARRVYLTTNGILYKLKDPKAIEYEKMMRERRRAKKKALEEEKAKAKMDQAKEEEQVAPPETVEASDKPVIDIQETSVDTTEKNTIPPFNIERTPSEELEVVAKLPVEEQLKAIHEYIIARGKMKMMLKVEYCTILRHIVKQNPQVKPTGMATREWISLYLGCSPRTVQNYLRIKNEKQYSKNVKAKKKALKEKKQKRRWSKQKNNLKNK